MKNKESIEWDKININFFLKVFYPYSLLSCFPIIFPSQFCRLAQSITQLFFAKKKSQ